MPLCWFGRFLTGLIDCLQETKDVLCGTDDDDEEEEEEEKTEKEDE